MFLVISVDYNMETDVFLEVSLERFLNSLTQVVKRPSIEELLASPVVSSQQTKMERQQASHQSNSSTDLKNREAELRALERELEQKKKDLDSRCCINGHNPINGALTNNGELMG